MLTPSFAIVSDEDFLQAHAPGEPFQVQVDGDQTSFLGRMRCAYFEWIYGRRHAGKLASYSVAYHSDTPLLLLSDGQRTAMPARRVRIYAGPSWEREYAPGDRSVPEVVQTELDKHRAAVFVAEYRLEAGKSYHALVREDRYHLPPEGPGKPPCPAQRQVLCISDRPFEGTAPQVEATPAFRSFSY